jgi:hypothetical protein
MIQQHSLTPFQYCFSQELECSCYVHDSKNKFLFLLLNQLAATL